MKRLLLILITISICASLYAQEPEKENKNATYFTFGIGPIFSANISYERMVWKPGHDLINELWIRGNVGALGIIFGEKRYSASVTAQVLSAGKVIHWDMGVGFLCFIDKNAAWGGILPTGNLGLRLQGKHNSPVFRFGIGFPDYVYASLGYAF